MPLLFDLYLPDHISKEMNKSLFLWEPDVIEAHREQVLTRLGQLGIDFLRVDDWRALDRSGGFGEYGNGIILLKNDNELWTDSIRILEKIVPERVFLVSILSNVFEMRLIRYREIVEKERAFSLPFSLYSSIENRLTLRDFARDCRAPGVILEIGTRYGASLVPLVRGNRENPSPTGVLSVDCFYHDYLESYLVEAGVDSEVVRFEMPSYRLARVWPKASAPHGGPSIKLLWIDGDHTYIGAKTDLVSFLPFLSEGGVVAVHDYSPEIPGIVKAVWEEILCKGSVYEDFQVEDTIFSARKKSSAKPAGVEEAVPAKLLAGVPNDPTDALIWIVEHLEWKMGRTLFCGGGRHTREILTFASSFFQEFFRSVSGVVDDNPECLCASLNTVPIYKFNGIRDLDFERIIISSYDCEGMLYEKLRSQGVGDERIVCLYTNRSFIEYITSLPSLRSIFRHEYCPAAIRGFKG